VDINRLGLIAAAWACLVTVPVPAAAQARFITVDQGSEELGADRLLARRVGSAVLETPEQFDYGAVIENLIADERREGTVARVTPYALVVAEMRGARLDPIATCRSKSTGRTVSNAFLVVRRDDFPKEDDSGPSLSKILEHLKTRFEPARFIYHNKLSTSSYFLPSLFFRAQRVFDLGTGSSVPRGTITTIRARLYEPHSSSELVKAIVTGQADVASVWDGPKSNFEAAGTTDYETYGKRVWFVKLPTDLPCDVLVATRKVDPATKQRIRDKLPVAIGADAKKSDVDAWVLWSESDALDAHGALSELRRQAAASTLPVVVDVRDSTTAPVGAGGLDAVRLAIRLAGTELVDKSEYYDYYVKGDTRWELEQIHDGAVRITVRYDNFKLGGSEVMQQFDVSFLKPEDLTRRVVSLIHSRLHRIRPIWLYRDAAPTVLRDVGFDVGELLPFQLIEWNDPQRNDYTVRGEPGEARLVRSIFNFELDNTSFPKRDGRLEFEPMGRHAFRVLLIRPHPERMLFQVLTVSFVLFFGLAAAGLVWDWWRWHTRRSDRRPWRHSQPATGPAAIAGSDFSASRSGGDPSPVAQRT
jgi:hypothetical protein